jgi:hypothetical protein
VPSSFEEPLDFLSACSNSEKNQLHERMFNFLLNVWLNEKADILPNNFGHSNSGRNRGTYWKKLYLVICVFSATLQESTPA